MCNFLSQGKCIPLSLTGSLVLEFELGDADDCFDTTTNGGFSWSLERMMLYADVLQVDPSVNNSFSQHLLSGKSLPVPLIGCFSFMTSLASSNAYATIPVQRGFSRFVSTYFTFVVNGAPPNSWFQSPLDGEVSNTDTYNYQVFFFRLVQKIAHVGYDGHVRIFLPSPENTTPAGRKRRDEPDLSEIYP